MRLPKLQTVRLTAEVPKVRKAIVGLFASLILFMDFKPKAVSQPNSNLVRNGSFERVRVGWVFSGDAEIAQQSDAPHRQKVLRCSRNGDMARQVIIAEPSTQYAVSLWVRTKMSSPFRALATPTLPSTSLTFTVTWWLFGIASS